MNVKRERYVYYRVSEEHLAAARAAVLAMQAALRERYPHLQARVLRRPQTSDSCQTWMETYACEPLGVTDEMGAAIEASASWGASFIRGARHVEEFEPCSC